MDSSIFQSFFDLRDEHRNDEMKSQREQNEIIPSAPTPSFGSFKLNESSFDFTMSQIFTPKSTSAFKTDGDLFAVPILSQKWNQQTPCHKNNSRKQAIIPETERTSFSGQNRDIDNYFNSPLVTPDTDQRGNKLRPVNEIPSAFRHIFRFKYFNFLQSTVLDEVLYTDRSVVVSAPTGSGKTAVFEIAIIRLMMKTEGTYTGKIIYMAPMKALCSERFEDWKEKFPALKCLQVTGDSELDDVTYLQDVNLICTTPEKWDSMSRRWKDKRGFFHGIRLFFIDEIHTLNDANRGATIEAVLSRMKTLQTASSLEDTSNAIRFIAVSATLPNYNDIAEWLSTPSKPASSYNIEEKHRPVKVDRFVIGYPFKKGTSDFRFDMNLSYRLKGIIDAHCHGKPTLVFCSSRKSVIQSAEILSKTTHSLLTHYNPSLIQHAAQNVHEQKVMDLLNAGIGIHHAGLTLQDRQIVEDLFRNSQLPVLVCTSTLAMGVNLPAHLVIIKSTHCYNMGTVEEYSDMQLLQMIGRAGRPQFDTSASAIIMTKTIHKSRYESLLNGTQLVESSLHKNLTEHLNAEIVLQTITDMALAVEWMRQTFLYVRVLKNPKYYGVPTGLSKNEVEKRLQDLCLKNLNQLTGLGLVTVEEESYEIVAQETGRLMARYCIAFETMKHFHRLGDHQESVADMLGVLSACAEFEDIQLRTNEKRILNTLNRDKNKQSIRFPLPGKIKNKQMKVNCLIQAQLSCLPIHDFSLSQDVIKIFRVGQRIAKCLMEYLYQQNNEYSLMLHAILVYKGLKTKLWFDSSLVSRQLDGIGPTMSLALAKSGLDSFQMLEQAHPRDIEVIVNRHAPFGNQVKEAVAKLPRYELAIEQVNKHAPGKAILSININLLNRTLLQDVSTTEGGIRSTTNHQALLLIGDEDNCVVFKWRIMSSKIVTEGSWTRTIDVKRALAGPKLSISLLSLEFVGLDIQTEYEPVYTAGWAKPLAQTPASKLKNSMNSKTEKNNPYLENNAQTRKPVKRENSAISNPGSNSKQIKMERKNKPDVLSLILKDMGNTHRISLNKFAYEKPKSLSHTPSCTSQGLTGNQPINSYSTTVLEKPYCHNQSVYQSNHSQVKNTISGKDENTSAIKSINGFTDYNDDDDFIWGIQDEDWYESIDEDERRSIQPSCHGDSFEHQNKSNGNEKTIKPRFNNGLYENNIKTSVSTTQLNCRGNGFGDENNSDLIGKASQSKLNSNLMDSKRGNISISGISNFFDNDGVNINDRYISGDHGNDTGTLTKTIVPSMSFFSKTATISDHVSLSLKSLLDSEIKCYSASANQIQPYVINDANMTHAKTSLPAPTSFMMSKVMGGDVDDFMKQQGYSYSEQPLKTNEDQKPKGKENDMFPATSQSDEELYQLAEEHDHYLLSQNNVDCASQMEDSYDIIEICSSSSSSVSSPTFSNKIPFKLGRNVKPSCFNNASGYPIVSTELNSNMKFKITPPIVKTDLESLRKTINTSSTSNHTPNYNTVRYRVKSPSQTALIKKHLNQSRLNPKETNESNFSLISSMSEVTKKIPCGSPHILNPKTMSICTGPHSETSRHIINQSCSNTLRNVAVSNNFNLYNKDEGISWSPLNSQFSSTQLSQEISPCIDGNGIINITNQQGRMSPLQQTDQKPTSTYGVFKSLPYSNVKSPHHLEIATSSTKTITSLSEDVILNRVVNSIPATGLVNTMKSPHQFGLVQTWPRKIKSRSHTALNGDTLYHEREKADDKNSSFQHSHHLTSMFAPQNTATDASDIYIPGKLFDGIFDSWT